MNNAEVTPQRACHIPSHTNLWIQQVKGATSGNLPIRGEDMLHTSNARFEPSRRDPGIPAPDWAIADPRRPERVSPPRRREPWGSADPAPLGVAVGRWRPRPLSNTHVRACGRQLALWGRGSWWSVSVQAVAGRVRAGAGGRARLRPVVGAAGWPAFAEPSSSPPLGAIVVWVLLFRREGESHDAEGG